MKSTGLKVFIFLYDEITPKTIGILETRHVMSELKGNLMQNANLILASWNQSCQNISCIPLQTASSFQTKKGKVREFYLSKSISFIILFFLFCYFYFIILN